MAEQKSIEERQREASQAIQARKNEEARKEAEKRSNRHRKGLKIGRAVYEMTPDGVHPEVAPARLAWACQTSHRRWRQYNRVMALGLPVPDCLLPIEGTVGAERDRIKDAIARARLQWVDGKEAVRAKMKRIGSKGGRKGKKMEVLSGAAGLTGAVSEAADAPPPEPKAPRPVGDQSKPPKEDSGRLEINNAVLPSLVPFDQDMSDATWLLVGAMGSGKSTAAIIKMIKHAAEVHPDGARYILLRNTYRELWDTVAKTFFRVVPQHFGWLDKRNEIFYLGKWEFWFRACERPEDVDKFKGAEITGYWIDEASEVKKDIKELLDGRLGRYPLAWKLNEETGEYGWRGTEHTLQVLTTNPPDEEHWLYQIFVARPLPNHKYIVQPPYENAHNLPRGYYDKLRDRYRDSPDLAKRYIEGKWGAVYRGKAVYPEYDSAFHLAKEPVRWMHGVRVVRGWDFGRTPACVFTQVLPSGQWVILAELFTQDMGIDEFAGAVVSASAQWFPGAEFVDFCDPAGFDPAQTDSRSCVDHMVKYHIHPRPGAKTLTPRLESVKRRLRMTDRGKPMLLVSPNCKILSAGFGGGYCYEEIGRTGIYTDKPAKTKHSHLHDALQYAASGLFGGSALVDEDRQAEELNEQYAPLDPEVGY